MDRKAGETRGVLQVIQIMHRWHLSWGTDSNRTQKNFEAGAGSRGDTKKKVPEKGKSMCVLTRQTHDRMEPWERRARTRGTSLGSHPGCMLVTWDVVAVDVTAA